MTITIEPFAKLDAVCAGCGRSASVARISFPFDRDRHVFCPSCLADLHRLTAPTAPALTVGAALASFCIAEAFRGEDWWQFRLVIGPRGGANVEARWRHLRARSWSTWGQPWEPAAHLALPCRLVPLALADLDPSTRGEIAASEAP